MKRRLCKGMILVVSHACIRSANREVYRSLRRTGYDIRLVIAEGVTVENGEFHLAEPPSPEDPPIHFRPVKGRNLRLLRYSGFFKLLNSIEPKIVFVEADPASLVAWEASIWCRWHGANLICRTNENLSWLPTEAVKRAGLSEWPLAVAKLVLHKLVQKAVSAVCTSSEQAKSLFHQRGYRLALNVPMGTDCKRFRYNSRVRRASRERLGVPASAKVVAYFGRLVAEKGVDTLIEALCHLKELPWFLLMNKFQVRSDYAKHIEGVIEAAGLTDRVIWVTGEHGQIAEAMMAADVVVLASRTTPKWVEQFGRVVPEAMACGAVVVVSDSGAPKELVAEPSLVFAEGDAIQLAALLKRLDSDPAACRMHRRKALRHARRHISIEVEAGICANLFESLSMN